MVASKTRATKGRKSTAASRKAALAKARDAKSASTSTPPSAIAPDPTPSSQTPPQQYDVAARQSASSRKLRLFATDSSPVTDDKLPLAIVDLALLSSLFSSCVCQVCGGSVKLSAGSRQGFAFQLRITCETCGDETSTMTSRTLEASRHLEINRQMVVGFLNIGVGFAGLSNFCESVGLDGLTELSHSRHVAEIHDASVLYKTQLLDEVAQRVKEAHGCPGEITDIAVSFDGSWQKRGHTSKQGLGAVIDVDTGLVVDYDVKSTHCQQCISVGKYKKAVSDEAYEEWLQSHKDVCTANHVGSSGAMEVEIAKVLWSRSQDRGFRYTTLVTDGDCKTHNELMKMMPYGEGTPVVKEECTNHVAKRLGTGLRNLVSSQKGKGVTLGGRKPGSLTQVKISLLQSHYKKAVASNCRTVEALRTKIWTTFDHASSSDENPKHQNCPLGTKSWCFFQRALAFGKTPPPHKGSSSSTISATVADACRPLYERLTSDALLERCLKGLTQNSNESLHSTIWAKCPKHLFVGRHRVEIAAALAIGSFNCGSKALQQLLRHSGCAVNQITINKGVKRDKRRISTADKRQTAEAKRRRTDIARATTAAQQQYLASEGGPCYASGSY